MDISFNYRVKPPWRPSDLAEQFMSAIIFWNQAEASLKQIVQLLLGQSYVSLAVSAEMGNRSLTQAIEAGSRLDELKEIAPHLQHLCKGFVLLLGYRNFYIHGIYATEIHNGERVARILSVDGKGKARIFNPTFESKDLRVFITHLHSLIGYSAAIQKALGADGDGLGNMIKAYQASLIKPVWPPQLKRVPTNLQAQVNRPLEAQG
ncbi:hypothetical protein FSZ31_03695 [Sphingorhabdus soli]|uniref:Uncharacterized protein n=1 Tax=Flavisphingopyxis soli TaxID=2601267 RepID=A0A5C6UMU6_9SPHN|nr:hypothetical protein [Sphingorhabdus soli]TXC73840.1 hypothetical protein FSZ31_03695 [Sphingorhabdus soli]